MENIVEGMEFVPHGVSTDQPASVSELEFIAGMPITEATEEPKFLTVDEVRAMEDRGDFISLTTIDFKKAYDDAVALWKPGHVRAKQTGYLLYNSLDLPIELSAHVLQYLFDRAAELAPPEAK